MARNIRRAIVAAALTAGLVVGSAGAFAANSSPARAHRAKVDPVKARELAAKIKAAVAALGADASEAAAAQAIDAVVAASGDSAADVGAALAQVAASSAPGSTVAVAAGAVASTLASNQGSATPAGGGGSGVGGSPGTFVAGAGSNYKSH